MANDLGHESIVSQDAYPRLLGRIRKQSVEQKLRNQAAELNDEIAQLRSENSVMRTLLDRVISNKSTSGLVFDQQLIEQAAALIHVTEAA
ncbi:hypothetical protein [Burkholderia gladioli]|uniref:hypothetical protein n=1 Tax=Burkholderia gladioli TaxID=28095 RepID=UPI00163FDF57|nr:hypothetical protein [Burkholderia gladioli]